MRPLKVFPNPWGVHPSPAASDKTVRRVLDHYGRPCLTVPRLDNAVSGIGVGARISRAKVREDHSLGSLRANGEIATPPQEVVWEFLGIETTDRQFAAKLAKAEPVEIPFHKYYLSALRSADLLPADAFTAKMAGYSFSPEKFTELERKALAGLDRDFLELSELDEEPAESAKAGPVASNGDKGGSKGGSK